MAATKNMNEWLASMEEKWAEQAAQSKQSADFERHPDGRYTCRTTGADLVESQNGRPQVAWIYTIIAGDLEGESLYAYDGLDGEKSLYYLALKLARYGYDPEEIKIRQLPRILKEIAEKKPVVKVRAITKGEFQNIHVKKVMPDDYDPELEEDEDYSGGGIAEDDDDAATSRSPRSRNGAAPTKPVATTPAPAPARPRTSAAPARNPIVENDEEDEEEEEEVRPVPARAAAPVAPAAKPRRVAPAPAPVAEPEPEEGEKELQVGMAVVFKRRGVDTQGTVESIDEENETVFVKVGNKSYPVDAAEIEIDS